MPKALKEIKHFHSGTVINSSEQDISDDTAAFSLNIDPMSKGGVLDSIKNDRLVLSTDNKAIRCLRPVSHGRVDQSQIFTDSSNQNKRGIIFEDISAFDEDTSIHTLNFIGTKGRKESLKASNLRPHLERLKVTNSLNAVYTPASTITATQDTIPIRAVPTITENLADTELTVTGTTTITAQGATLADFDGKLMTIVSLDGKSVQYEFGKDNNEGASGTHTSGQLTSGGNTLIQLNGEVDVSGIADEIEKAIEHANGHNGRISVERASGVLTLTYSHASLGSYLNIGDYFTLNTSTFSFSENEVIKVESIDSTDNVIRVKRGCFGSRANSYSSSTEYELHMPLINIGNFTLNRGFQIPTKKGYANLSNWSSYSGNHIGGSGTWAAYSVNDDATDGTESNGFIDTTGANQSVVFSASAKTITLGSSVAATKFSEGDTVTFYYGDDGDDLSNNGKSFKILKIDSNTLHVDTAPADGTESAHNLYIEGNLLKNHTFHHSSDEVNPTVEVGSDQDYKVNHWLSKNYTHDSTTASNVYTNAGSNTFVSKITSGGYWEDTLAEHGADNAGNFYPFNDNDAYISIEAHQNKVNNNIVKLIAACSATDNFLHAGDLSRLSVGDIINAGENELVTDGSFETSGNWTQGTGWSVSDSPDDIAIATAGSESSLSQSIDIIPGVLYKVYMLIGRSAGSITPYLGGTPGAAISSGGAFTQYIKAGNTNTLIEMKKDASFAGNVGSGVDDSIGLSVANIEHMKITSMTDNKLYVQRGYLNTVPAAHSADSNIYKGVNPLIEQEVSKDRLKTGQNYALTFYAKDLQTDNMDGYGSLAVTFNGGYINKKGNWIKPELSSDKGYYTNPENIMYEEKWIDFQDLDKPNKDYAVSGTYPTYFSNNPSHNGLDSVWRQFRLFIKIPKNIELLTDLKIQFASRGIDGSKIGIDLVDLSEDTLLIPYSNKSKVNSVGSINNSGEKDLVLYDSYNKQLNVSKNFKEDNLDISNIVTNIDKSNYSPFLLKSKTGKASFISNNRESHIGFGSKSEDSTPQWLGYLNSQLFGIDNSNTLYQDEDTVHSFDEEGLVTMSKICLAGEHENLTVASWSAPNLRINHTAHKMKNGNNIVVREYQDINNSWDGNGVWVVTDDSNADYFLCQRIDDKDVDPSGVPSNSKVSWRPYYYYGIKDGDPHLYRIIPDDVYTSASGLSTLYTKGKIESSLTLPFIPTSITTCYNKDTTNGLGGGRVYILTNTGEIKVVNVEVKYNEWSKVNLNIVSSLVPKYKSYKWSNDNANGDVNGNTEVYGGLSSASTPSITPSGIPSDIIETKGPNKDFSHSSTNNTDNTLVDFDTRLWIQFRPGGDNNFTSGDRFLFCGLTNSSNTDNNTDIYLGDRTPPTTGILPKETKYTTDYSFIAGPGLGVDDDGIGDIPTDDVWKYALYNHTKESGGINQIFIKTNYDNSQGELYGHVYGSYYPGQNSTVFRWSSQVNFGDNVGWDLEEGIFPSIKVAKYGLFPMGDNNCDGVIDGTGLVVPSSTTLPDSFNNQELGPYGWDNEKVCAHAVGLIGGSESLWIRDFGKLDGSNLLNTDHYKGSDGGAPENMSVQKCLFICSDVHFGDKPFNFDVPYGWEATAFASATVGGSVDRGTLITISDTTGLQPGDSIWVDWDNTDGVYTVVKINSATQFTVAMEYTSSNAGLVYPHTIKPFVLNAIGSQGVPPGSLDVNHTDLGGIKDNHFHWAYNPDDPKDSTIFEGTAGGHFSKTWWTPPSSNGLHIDSGNFEKPGMLNRVERLNYRAGYMIRPFDLNDNTFEDLIIGNGTYIDSPVRPEPIFYTANGSNTHNNIGGNVDNQFASKIFITSPVEDSEDRINKSKMFICDPMFEYPDILHQIEKDWTGSGFFGDRTTNAWNNENTIWDDTNTYNWKSYEPLIYGKIDGYVTSSAETTNAHRNAHEYPLIQIDPGADIVDNNSLLSGSSVWRQANRFAGQMLTIVDADTGTMQTRYIVASDTAGTGATDDLFVAVHYPFGHAPAANDLFYIWSHKYACTSPIRLFKEKELDFSLALSGVNTIAYEGDPILESPIYTDTGRIGGIDGNTTLITVDTALIHHLSTGDVVKITNTTNYNDLGAHSITVTDPKQFTISGTFSDVAAETNGDWVLQDANHNDSSVSNPLEFDMPSALVKSSFGGLDMRKCKSLSTEGTDITNDSGTRGYANVDGDHFLFDGDTVTMRRDADTSDDWQGVYEITKKDADEFYITNTTNANDTDAWNITTNQWENIIISTTGGGSVGEIRAGLNSWDTGEATGNVVRKDNESASNDNKYLAGGFASVLIESPSLGDETNDYFLKNNRYDYKISLIYDGYQEGLLSNNTWSFDDPNKTRAKLNIQIKILNFSKRLTAVCLYRRDNLESFYRLVKEIDTSSGWAYDGFSYNYSVEDTGNATSSYESRTGLSEVLSSIKLKYGISAEIDGYLFAGDCSHENIKNASNQIFRSKPGMYSIFDFSTDFIQLKSKPTALVNFNGRLYAFDETNIYKINQQNLTTEDIYEGIGCLGKDSVIVTEYGMFFADKNGAYIHNGTSPNKISSTIESGGESSETWGGTDNINNVSWKTVAGTSISEIPYVSFDSESSSVLFFVNYNNYNSTTNNNKSIYYCWSFNLIKKRWDLWELAEDCSIGVPFIGDKGGVFIPIDSGIYHYKGGSTKRDYTWLSKKLTMEEDSVVKVYNKVKINGLTSNLNLSGNNKESSDRLLIKTSSGDVSSPSYSESDNQNSQYKLSGSNKKGRWLQFKLEDMTEPVESIGIIYRRKSAK